MEHRITERISYFPASQIPLSSDVGIVRGDSFLWLFDVGASPAAAELIRSLPGEKAVVLSHFHADHTANIKQIDFKTLYAGTYTCKKLGRGIPVNRDIFISDGISLHLFPLPSSHAKSCVGFEINGEYAFVGDAIYGAAAEDGRRFYNVSLLYDEIETLKTLSADFLLLSHDKKFIYPRKDIIFELQTYYEGRERNNPYIYI